MNYIQLVDDFIEYKQEINPNFIVCTYFDLRVKLNLKETEFNNFIYPFKNKLENNGYKIYRTGQEYTYNNYTLKVKDNELIIAIKEKVI